MNEPTKHPLSIDDLLTQATCAVLIGNEIKGTAWLFGNAGYLLTAGNILGKNNPLDEVLVRFAGDVPRKAHRIQWGYQMQMGIDFAVLKLEAPPAHRQSLPISLGQEANGTFKAHGYHAVLESQATDKEETTTQTIEIPSGICTRLRHTLLTCGSIDTDRELKDIFIDTRISPWRNKLPQANNVERRVNAIISFLLSQYNDINENALVLFLRVLNDLSPIGTACRRDLAELVYELERLPSVERKPTTISEAQSVLNSHSIVAERLQGEFIGCLDLQNTPHNRLFRLHSQTLSKGSHNGIPIFSEEQRSVVAVQFAVTGNDALSDTKETAVAMPLYRIAQLWRALSDFESLSPISLPTGNPFPGLRPFREQDAKIFSQLGRSGETAEIIDFLEDPKIRAVIVYGEPGAGKTSLIQAGVLPHLNERGKLIPKTIILDDLDLNHLDKTIHSQIDSAYQYLLQQQKGPQRADNLLLVFDQFEYGYEGGESAWQTVTGLIVALIQHTPFKILIGIRREYVLKVDDAKYFPDRNVVAKVEIDRLEKSSAVNVICNLTQGVFSDEAAQKLVTVLCGNTPKPYTPYIQIVGRRLWRELVLNQGKSKVVPEDFNASQIQNITNSYLEENIPETKPAGLTSKVLRSLVKQGHAGSIIANPMTIQTIAQKTGIEEKIVASFIQEIHQRNLVYFDQNQLVHIVHDFLGKIIFDKYDEQSIQIQQAADRLVESFGIILEAGMSEDDRERAILSFTRDFLNQQYVTYSERIEPEDQTKFLDRMTVTSELLKTLLETLLSRNKLNEVCILVDIFYQLLLILKTYDRAEALRRYFIQVLQEKFPKTKIDHIIHAYQTGYHLCWDSMLHGGELDKDSEDYKVLQKLLRIAQQERGHTIVDLRDYLKLDTRLTLWRLLYKLWQEGEIYQPVQTDQWPLFTYEWILAPKRSCLEKYQCVEDHRTYHYVIVHIPAGEHAMRNQRAARKLLIRTVAVEQGWRGTAPGYHEADDKRLINSYSDEEIYRVLSSIVKDSTVMLNKPDSKIWVVLEAQEYPIENIVNISYKINEELKNDQTIQGRIITDVGASIANRKDLTRGLATLADIPQMPYQVLAVKREETWRHLWRAGIERKDTARWLPEDWGTLSTDNQKKIWLHTLQEAIEAVGGCAMIKPITTEFLKGATPVESTNQDMELAWERVQRRVGFPSVVVEKFIPNIQKELLVIVIKDPNKGYIDIPPVWYRCTHGYDWRADKKHHSVPVAMDYAWVHSKQDVVTGESFQQAQKIFEKAREYSRRVAEQLWDEIEIEGYEVQNHFLELEWFVLDNGELMLNEMKPTQLDKGIISNVAFTHSDSELLVRNLFRLPLPDKVQIIRPQETLVCGAILTKSNQDIEMIVKDKRLIGYDGIAPALELGVDVFLYADKFRSVPYIGRRMGILTVSTDNLENAEKIFKDACAMLEPKYET